MKIGLLHPRPPHAGLGPLWSQLAVALAYIGGGVFSIASGLVTRGASGQTAVVWLPPGVALAILLICGKRKAVGIAAGALVLDALMSWHEAPEASLSIHATLTLSIAIAMVVQALATVAMVQRFAGPRVVLDRPQTVFAYLGSVMLPSGISATLGSAALIATGIRPFGSFLVDWTSWWISDLVSTLLVTPVVLAWFAEPASVWRPRRLRVSLPLMIAVILVASAYSQANRLENERGRKDFEIHVDALSVAIQRELSTVRESAQVMSNLMTDDERVSGQRFLRFAGHVRERNPSVSAIAWVQRVSQSERSSFEQAHRSSPNDAFSISEPGANGQLETATERPEYLAIAIAQTSPGLQPPLGLDLNTLPDRRELLELTRRREDLTMSAPLELFNRSANGWGILVAVPVASASGQNRGFVVCVIQLRQLLERAFSASAQRHLDAHLRDTATPLNQRPVFETVGHHLDRDVLPYTTSREFSLGGRTWKLELKPTAAHLAANRSWVAPAVSVIGLAFSALLCGFLLVTTGHSANIQRQVVERTLELSRANEKLLDEIETHRRTEQALKESELRWQFALEEAGEGVWDWDVPTERVFWSPKLARVLGYEVAELDDGLEKWSQAMHSDDRERALGQIEQHLSGATPAFETEFRMRRKDGSWVWFAVRGKVVERGADGRALRVIGTQTDISQQKSSEQELRAHRERLEELVQRRTCELEQAKRAAEDANRAKSLFFANMSHELRTPMHAIMAYARLGIEREPNGRTRSYFERVVDGADRLLVLLNDLLDLSKLEAGKMKLDLAPSNLMAMVREVATELEPLLGKKELTLTLIEEQPGDSYVAVVDRSRLAQVFYNILANAVRFSSANSRIEVRFARMALTDEWAANAARNSLRIQVIDQGIGIPHDELESIFDSFVQSRKTQTKAGGTGLGLAICRQLLALHDATISASNNSSGGATFTVIVPVEPTDRRRAA